jgi:hypothetical protein
VEEEMRLITVYEVSSTDGYTRTLEALYDNATSAKEHSDSMSGYGRTEEYPGVLLDDGNVIVNRAGQPEKIARSYLDHTRKNAIKKLTPEERRALGVTE